jgi:hypothetical protein
MLLGIWCNGRCLGTWPISLRLIFRAMRLRPGANLLHLEDKF